MTEEERLIGEYWYGGRLFQGRPLGWQDMDEAEKKMATAAWRKKHPPKEARPDHVTHEELREAIEQAAHAFGEEVRQFLTEQLANYSEKTIQPKLAAQESQFAGALDAALAAAETAAKMNGSTKEADEWTRGFDARLNRLRNDFDDIVNGKLASLERRASRGADHNARLEDRVRALEGK